MKSMKKKKSGAESQKAKKPRLYDEKNSKLKWKSPIKPGTVNLEPGTVDNKTWNR